MPFVGKTMNLVQYNVDSAQAAQQQNDIPPADLNTFLNSLFDPWPGPFAENPGSLFRAGLVDLIKLEEVNGNAVSPICWLADNATITLVVDVLEGYWKGDAILKNPSPRAIKTDEKFINFIRNYIDNNSLQLRVPGFQCKKAENDKPSTYEWVGDQTYSFKNNNGLWDSAVVRRFLELLLAGAHFVVVHSAADLGANVKMPSFFDAFSALGTKYTGHSHYTDNPPSLYGVNYPELALVTDEGDTLDELKAGKDAVLLPVVLCDTTASSLSHHNSFFQMEGWRPGKSMLGFSEYKYRHKALAGGYRHGADFNTHQKTLWNISTYGASLFSEKRGAPVFLAPKEWMAEKTHLYAGFSGSKGGHAWFKSDLVTGLF